MRIGKKKSANDVFKELTIEPTFGQLVRSVRITDNLTQETLAKELRVTKQFISQIENDKRSVSLQQAKRIVEVLGYPIEGFIESIFKGELKKACLFELNVEINRKAA